MTITTQYARNGPLLAEAREYVQLIARGLSSAERRQLMVIENGLRRNTHKARRNIFEALEMRFADERRARNLGFLALSTATSRSFTVGAFVELARHDQLIKEYVEFLIRHIDMPASLVGAPRFLDELDQRNSAIQEWSPVLRRRAIAALEGISQKFDLWKAPVGDTIVKIDIPIELAAIIFQENIEDGKPPTTASEFKMLGLVPQKVIELLWACARRHWFAVDVTGDVVRAESSFGDVRSMLASLRQGVEV